MTVEEIEKAVTTLSRKERARLAALLEELDAAEFDAKIERDAKSGKLDRFAQEAQEEVRAGRFRKL